MNTMALSGYLNSLFRVQDIQDTSLNGLQVENDGNVSRVGLAVDISQTLIEKAHEAGVDFLIVHHGLFWGKPIPVTGPLYRRIRSLMEYNIALYAIHLPLDVHPELGNNAQIQMVLDWNVGEDIVQDGISLGKEIVFDPPKELSGLVRDLRTGLDFDPKVWNFGPRTVSRAAFISGAGIRFLDHIAASGIHTLVTGEPRHDAYWMARELELNVILAGHYATETLGVQAVGNHLKEKFGLASCFIDLPTGY
jgi:dinuclear metal center YbgI/SA1388 family protein